MALVVAARRWALLAAMGGTLLASGCGDDKGSSSARFPDSILAALEEAELSPKGFSKIPGKPYGAKTCTRGKVKGVHVLLCDFAKAPERGKVEKQIIKTFVGVSVTAAIRLMRTWAVVVADQDRVDLKGQTINRILKAVSKFAPEKKSDKKDTAKATAKAGK